MPLTLAEHFSLIEAELAEDLAHVPLRPVERDVAALGDLGVGVAVRNQAQHIPLASV